MLYDNAQLASAYLTAFQATGEARYAQVARETLDYLLRDLRDSSGGFHASEDADSEGEEGKFYVFTPGEVREALGEADGARFCAAFGITEEGNFEHGRSVAHRFSCVPEAALAPGEDADLRTRLRAWRDRRVRPGKDDKVLAGWNGLALSALARGFQVLGEPRYLDAARACAAFLRRELWTGNGLVRVWRGGKAHTPAFLEDYGAVAEGLVDLFEADFDAAWLRWAEVLGEAMVARFDDSEGGFFSTEAGQADLLFRQKPGFDNAVPSGNTLAARAMLRLSRHLDREDFRCAVEGTLRAFGPWMARAPRAFLGLSGVLDQVLREPLEIIVSGDPSHPSAQALLAEARRRHLPGRVVSASAEESLPLHRGRRVSTSAAAACVCRGRSCSAPVSTPAALERLLGGV
jgi:uncharacterized protein YyaL (SSP411 family)